MAVPVIGLLVPIVQMYVIYYTMIAMRMLGAFAIIGAWFGLAQWLVLRRHVRAAFLWVPATALAWSAWHLQYSSFRVSLITIGLLGGAICGAAIAFLPVREKPAPAFTQVGLSG